MVGQDTIRDKISKILSSDRLSHAYLLAGQAGIGKKALALAFAEAVNGIDHLTDLQGRGFSKKTSWMNHPDIRIFLPLPGTDPEMEELSGRTSLLAKDPYEVVDFNNRPSLSSEEASGNRNAFYAVKYFSKHIRPAAYLKPNEGFRNVIIISEVERMRKEVSNAFLKLLEEPPANLMFILTTENANRLLPTITSRCQILKCTPLKFEEIKKGLVERDGVNESEADFLARVSGGNYSMTRFFDTERLEISRKEVLNFLRSSYAMDAGKIVEFSTKWNKELNTEGQVSILNLLEVFIRDIAIYMETRSADLITNIDQVDVISKFCDSLKSARLDEMLDLIEPSRAMLRQNISSKLVFTVLSNRFTYLMRGRDTVISDSENWKHLPAF